jgi:hypothetical protein
MIGSNTGQDISLWDIRPSLLRLLPRGRVDSPPLDLLGPSVLETSLIAISSSSESSSLLLRLLFLKSGLKPILAGGNKLPESDVTELDLEKVIKGGVEDEEKVR